MKLSKKLHQTGALGRQKTGHTKWIFDQRLFAAGSASHDMAEGSICSLHPIRGLQRGWRLLNSILRLIAYKC